MADRNELVKTLIRGIIVSCGEEGATISEIEKEYKNIMSKNWPLSNSSSDEKSKYLQAISGVSFVRLKGKDVYVICIEPRVQPVDSSQIQIPEISSNPVPAEIESNNIEKQCESNEKNSQSGAKRNILNPLAAPYQGHSPPIQNSDYSNENDFININQQPLLNPIKRQRVTYDSPIIMLSNNGINWTGNQQRAIPVANEEYLLPTFNNMPVSNANYIGHYPNEHPGVYQNDYQGNYQNGYPAYQGYQIIPPTTTWPGISSSSGVETGYTVETSSATNSIRSNQQPNQQYPFGMQQLPPIQPYVTVIPMSPRHVADKVTSSQPKAAVVNEFCEIMGDDLMLDMAKSLLSCADDNHLRPKRCGLTASGQSIFVAVNKLKQNITITKPYVIIYLGTIDILESYELMDMKFNYEVLINNLLAKGHTPIITTIAPLPAGTRRQNQMIFAFNRFLLERFSKEYNVIDLAFQLVNERGYPLLDCFKPYKTSIGRKQMELVLWNRAGRQRILRHIKRVVSTITD